MDEEGEGMSEVPGAHDDQQMLQIKRRCRLSLLEDGGRMKEEENQMRWVSFWQKDPFFQNSNLRSRVYNFPTADTYAASGPSRFNVNIDVMQKQLNPLMTF